MTRFFQKCGILVLVLLLVVSMALPGKAYTQGEAFHQDLTTWIQHEPSRQYVEMMLDHYIRNDEMVRSALDGGFAAVFLFDGCSDHLLDPVLSDLSYYRVSGVCVAVKKDASGQLRMIYFNDSCSTIPDRPLEYGAWSLPEVGNVGPATIFDGTYQLYSIYHKGKYRAFQVRTEYHDGTLDAVYMTPEGFTTARASEINVHTRTSNHIIERGMWSAGCPLVGGGHDWEFWKLVESVYFTSFDTFEVDTFVGTLTIDRQCLRRELYTLYKNPDAVDTFLARSRQERPEMYLRDCGETEFFEAGQTLLALRETSLMTLPCSNATDARSLKSASVEKGQALEAVGRITNTAGNTWFLVNQNGETRYVYGADVKKQTWLDRLLGIFTES